MLVLKEHHNVKHPVKKYHNMMQYSYLVASRLTVVVATSVAVLMAQYTRLIEGTTLRLVFISFHKV